MLLRGPSSLTQGPSQDVQIEYKVVGAHAECKAHGIVDEKLHGNHNFKNTVLSGERDRQRERQKDRERERVIECTHERERERES